VNDALAVLCSVALFAYQNNEDMIHYLCAIKKRELVYLFLSLSFTHFTMIDKKHTSLLLAKIGTDISNYGTIVTFESLYRHLYLLVLIMFNRTLFLSVVLCFYM
jgi:hypothetical protein